MPFSHQLGMSGSRQPTTQCSLSPGLARSPLEVTVALTGGERWVVQAELDLRLNCYGG